MSDESVFAQMGSLVRVRHVQSGLGPSFSVDTPIHEIEKFLDSGVIDPDDFADVECLVVKDRRPVGWFSTLDMCSAIGSGEPLAVEDLMSRIDFSQLICADVALLEAAELLSPSALAGAFFFVLDGKEITGTISFGDIFKPPGVMCLFALMVELESAAIALCSAFPKQCWEVLSEERKEKAREVWRKRLERHSEEAVRRLTNARDSARDELYRLRVECTTFIDKAKMIGKCKLLIDWSRSKVDSLFNRAEEVRNACAHPGRDNTLRAMLWGERFVGFVRDCRHLIESIRMVTPTR